MIKYRIKRMLEKAEDRIKKKTTVKPRWFDHSYHDKVVLMPFIMFELLFQFLENECDLQPDLTIGENCFVDWYTEEINKIIKVNGKEVYVIDEMIELYRWFRDEYLPFYKNELPLYERQAEISPEWAWEDFEGHEGYKKLNFIFKNKAEEKEYDKLCKQIFKLEEKMEKELDKRMQRLCAVRQYMWT